MNFNAIRYVVISNRAINITNKKFSINVLKMYLPVMYLSIKMHGLSQELTVASLGYYLRKSDQKFSSQYVMYRLEGMEQLGLLTKVLVHKRTKKGLEYGYNLYTITPLLLEYMSALERQIKKTRWDW